MNLDHLLPFAGSHSVQSVGFAADWLGDLSDQTILRIHALQSEFQPHFGKVDLQKAFQINFGPGGAPTGPQSQTVGGVVFVRQTDLGTADSHLQVSRNNCIFIFNIYPHWAPALATVRQYFEKVFKIILADKPISSIGLQYTDLFTWKDDPDLLSMKEFFRPNTALVPRNALEIKSEWHAHHGFKLFSKTPIDHDLLDNVNVNVADVAGERTIQITLSHRATLAKPFRLSTPDYMDIWSSLSEQLHTHSKEVLTDLLSDEVGRRINLVQ